MESNSGNIFNTKVSKFTQENT